jgi:hypothetical protein
LIARTLSKVSSPAGKGNDRAARRHFGGLQPPELGVVHAAVDSIDDNPCAVGDLVDHADADNPAHEGSLAGGSLEQCTARRSGCRSANETELRGLMIAGLAGDAAAYKTLLERLTALLRGYYKARLARIGRGAAEAEDLVQEALMAMHTRPYLRS